MININKDSDNRVVVTLCDTKVLSGTTYLFNLKSLDSQLDINFISHDTSTSCGYSQFQIIETGKTSQNLTASTVNLEMGSYQYKIYQQSSQTNLNPIDTDGRILEKGNLKVYGTPQPKITSYTGKTTNDVHYLEYIP